MQMRELARAEAERFFQRGVGHCSEQFIEAASVGVPTELAPGELGEIFPVVPFADGVLHALEHGGEGREFWIGGREEVGLIAKVLDALAKIVERLGIEFWEIGGKPGNHAQKVGVLALVFYEFLLGDMGFDHPTCAQQAVVPGSDGGRKLLGGLTAVVFERALERGDAAKGLPARARLIVVLRGEGVPQAFELGEMDIDLAHVAEGVTQLHSLISPTLCGVGGGVGSVGFKALFDFGVETQGGDPQPMNSFLPGPAETVVEQPPPCLEAQALSGLGFGLRGNECL